MARIQRKMKNILPAIFVFGEGERCGGEGWGGVWVGAEA